MKVQSYFLGTYSRIKIAFKKICPPIPTLKKKNFNSNSLYLHPPSFITSQLVLNANCPWNSTAAVNEMGNAKSLWTGSVHANSTCFLLHFLLSTPVFLCLNGALCEHLHWFWPSLLPPPVNRGEGKNVCGASFSLTVCWRKCQSQSQEVWFPSWFHHCLPRGAWTSFLRLQFDLLEINAINIYYLHVTEFWEQNEAT